MRNVDTVLRKADTDAIFLIQCFRGNNKKYPER